MRRSVLPNEKGLRRLICDSRGKQKAESPGFDGCLHQLRWLTHSRLKPALRGAASRTGISREEAGDTLQLRLSPLCNNAIKRLERHRVVNSVAFDTVVVGGHAAVRVVSGA